MPLTLQRFQRAKRAHLRLGRRGEDAAVKLLRARGMTVIARNVAGPRGEIDVVARDGAVLCFVEVKTRRRSARSRPADAVTAEKKKRIARTAKRYLRLLGDPAIAWRIDVIEVIFQNNTLHELRYWPNEVRTAD